MEELKKALDVIQAQMDKLDEYHPARMAGMQLQDILRRCPAAAAAVLQDMQGKGYSLADCEKKIKAKADEIRKKRGGNVAIPPHIAEGIIREFYGIEEFDQELAPAAAEEPAQPVKPHKKLLRLADFMD